MFGDKEKKYPYPALKSRFTCTDESISADIEKLINEKKADSEEFNRLFAEYEETVHQYYKYVPSGLYTSSAGKAFIKFGGTGGNAYEEWHINSVVENGKKIYVLNFKKKPNISNDDQFFLAKSFTDGFNRKRTAIYARGTVSIPGEEIHKYKDEWVKQIDWLPEHPWTVFIKDFELLRAELKDCIFLEDIHKQYGHNIYAAYFGKENVSTDLSTIHNRRSHLYLSEYGAEMIHNAFEKRALSVGVKKYIKHDEIDTYDASIVIKDIKSKE